MTLEDLKPLDAQNVEDIRTALKSGFEVYVTCIDYAYMATRHQPTNTPGNIYRLSQASDGCLMVTTDLHGGMRLYVTDPELFALESIRIGNTTQQEPA